MHAKNLIALLTVLSTTAVPAIAQVPDSLLHPLFNPGTNVQPSAQQGYSVAVDGNIAVAALPGAGLVKVYDATTGALLHTLVNTVTSVGVSGARVVVGEQNRGVTVYDMTSATPSAAYVFGPGEPQ
jgi:hypothetical protein